MLNSRLTVMNKTDTVTVLKEYTVRGQSDIKCDECYKRTKEIHKSKTYKRDISRWTEGGIREIFLG